MKGRSGLPLILAAIRSLLFMLFFYIGSFFIVLGAFLASYSSKRLLSALCMAWSHYHRWCARWILGQKVRIIGERPAGSVLVVMKHESMFEAIDIVCLFDRAMVAAKKELVDIPGFGKAAKAYGIVPIERGAGMKAIRTIQAAGKEARETGRVIGLFPEGTRVPHGERPPLQSGFAALYVTLKAPVVPIAVDSGLLAPRGSFIKWPGTITYLIGETIPPGLPRDEAEARAHVAINALNR